MKKKRIYPSGAQKRKERAARESASKPPTRTLVPSNSWGGMSDYTVASYQWDPNAPPQELPLFGAPPPTLVRQISGAILQLEQGAFYSSAYLWDGMTRDDRVWAKLSERINRLIGAPRVFTPADEDSEQAQEISDAAEKRFKKMMPLHQQFELIRYALGLSIGIAQVLTDRDDVKSATLTTKVWNPRNLRYDQTIRNFRLVTENRGEITVDPQDPEWIVYQPFGLYGWMHGALIRAIAQPWLIRYWTRTWWSREREVHGQPMRLGVIPADRTPADETRFLSQLSNLAHEAVIRLPQGLEGNKFDVKLLESQANSWEGFEKLLAHCDDSIAITFLGQSQSTKGQGGLGSQENAGESTIARVTRMDAEQFSEVVEEKLLEPWTEANYGNVDLSPTINWETEPPEDEKDASITDMNIGAALMAFKNAEAPVDIRAYLSERGYPLLTEQQQAQLKLEAQQKAQMESDQAHEKSLALMAAKKGSPPPAVSLDKQPPPSNEDAK